MTKVLKDFIEQRGHLLDDNNFKQLFLDAYDELLMTSEVHELHEMLLDAGIIDSTEIRNELLYKVIEEKLEMIRLRHPTDLNTEEMLIIETYVLQFLRRYLNNTFGFSEHEAVDLIRDNQAALHIKLEQCSGYTSGVQNYRIEYI